MCKNRERERDVEKILPVVPNSFPTSRYATCLCDSLRMREGSTFSQREGIIQLPKLGHRFVLGGLYRLKHFLLCGREVCSRVLEEGKREEEEANDSRIFRIL